MDKRTDELRDKLILGINLAVRKLIEKKSQTDGELIYSNEGKIIRVKAKDLK